MKKETFLRIFWKTKPLHEMSLSQRAKWLFKVFVEVIIIANVFSALFVLCFGNFKSEPSKTEKPKVIYEKKEAKKAVEPDNVFIKGDHYFGCRSKDKMLELINIASSPDTKAFNTALNIGLVTGQCKIFKKNELVHIMDYSLWDGLVLIRQDGKIISYWTSSDAVD